MCRNSVSQEIRTSSVIALHHQRAGLAWRLHSGLEANVAQYGKLDYKIWLNSLVIVVTDYELEIQGSIPDSVGVEVQLHATAALPPGKELLVPIK
jgi:hypothetical protein